MKKAVLFSIKPKPCGEIISEIKGVEVRKRIPKLSVPFTAYIYETKGRKITTPAGGVLHEGRGKVIGEFVCKRIDKIGKRGIDNNFDYCYLSLNKFGNDDVEIEITDIKKSCISKDDLNKYGADVPHLYALHISDLVIYEEPKDLSEFEKSWSDNDGNWHDIRPCENGKHCEHDVFDYSENTSACSIDFSGEHCPYTKLTRPPQSWCYVEKLRGVG